LFRFIKIGLCLSTFAQLLISDFPVLIALLVIPGIDLASWRSSEICFALSVAGLSRSSGESNRALAAFCASTAVRVAG
jgi:hypothetical protein